MDMPGADRGDVRLGFGQHRPVIRKSFHATELLGGRGEALGIRIGDGHDGRLRDLQPDGVLAVAVVALTGMTDDPDGQGAVGRLGAQERGGQGHRRGGEEIATFHGVPDCCALSLI